MDDEKLQKTIEFILSNQAQFTVEMQQIQESHRDSAKRIGTLERVSLNLYNSAVEQGKLIAEQGRLIAEQTKNVNQLSVAAKDLRESQKETGERLNAVIVMFEKFLDNQNGTSK